MERLPEMREKIAQYPVPKPVFTVETDYSGDLTFKKPDNKVPSPFEEPTWLEKEIDENVSNELEKKEDDTYHFVNRVDNTESSVISSVLSDLKYALKKAMPNKEPTRTALFKWFRGYSPRTDKEKEFILAIKDYVIKNREECEMPKSKHAQALIGLIAHIRGKNDR